MDIFNSSVRKVVCIRNNDSNFFHLNGDSSLLVVGNEYTVVDVDVHSWHTRVELKEFPFKWFNSVLFEEVNKEG